MIARHFAILSSSLLMGYRLNMRQNYNFASSPLQFVISQIRTLDSFFYMLQDKQRIKQSQLSLTCLKFSQLIRLKQNFNFQKDFQPLNNYLASLINSLDFNNLSFQEFCMNLTLASSLKKNNYHSTQITKYCNLIKGKIVFFCDKIDNLQQFSSIIDLYFYSCRLRSSDGQNICKKIYTLIQSQLQTNTSQFTLLSNMKICNLLIGIADREQLFYYQQKILNQTTQEIQNRINKLKISDMLKIVISLSSIKINHHQRKLVNSIFERIFNEIQELNPSDVFMILRISNFQNKQMQRLYKKVVKNLFIEIQQVNQMTLNDDFVMKFFKAISRNNKLSDFTQLQQNIFWENIQKICQRFQLQKRMVDITLITILDNNFLTQDDVNKLFQICQKYIGQLSLQLCYHFSIFKIKTNDMNLKRLYDKTIKFSEVKTADFFYYAILIAINLQMDPSNIDLQQKSQQVKNLMLNNYFPSKNFCNLMNRLQKYNIFKLLDTYYHQYYFKTFLDNFESYGQQKNHVFYILYICHAINITQSNKLLKDIVPKINLITVANLHNFQKHGQYQSKSQVLKIYQRKWKQIIKQDHIKAVYSLSTYISQFILPLKKLLKKTIIINSIFQLLNNAVDQIQNSSQNMNKALCKLIKIAFSFQFKNACDYDIGYRKLLIKMFANRQFFNKKFLVKLIINENINHNLLSQNKVPLYQDIKKYNLGKQSELIIKIYNQQQNIFDSILKNSVNLVYFLIGNKPSQLPQFLNVQQFLSELSVFKIQQCLIHYNLGRNQSGLNIYRALLRKLIDNQDYYPRLSSVFDIYHNSVRNKLSNIIQSKNFMTKTIQRYSQKKYMVNIQDHISLAYYMSKIYIFSQTYLKNIFNQISYEVVSAEANYRLLYASIDSNYDLTAKELQLFPKMRRTHPTKSIKMFLFLQDIIPQEKVIDYLKLIIYNLDSIPFKYRKMKKTYFQYLNKKYPQIVTSAQNYDFYLQNQDFAAITEIQQIFQIFYKVYGCKFNRKIIAENSCFYQIQQGKKKVVLTQAGQNLHKYNHRLINRLLQTLYNETIMIQDLIIINARSNNNRIAMFLAKKLNLVEKDQQLMGMIKNIKSQETQE